jgi:hypothetical protein
MSLFNVPMFYSTMAQGPRPKWGWIFHWAISTRRKNPWILLGLPLSRFDPGTKKYEDLDQGSNQIKDGRL